MRATVKGHVVWRARKMVLGETDEEYERDYQFLEPFLTMLAEKNPGTITQVERHPNNHYKRHFFMLSTSIKVGMP